MAITTAQQTAIMETASALFNKAFSPEMVTGFVNFYEANGNDLGKLADALIGSSVYEAQYAGAATVAEFGSILMAKYGLSWNGTSAAETNMKAFVEYSFAHAADTNSLRTIQAVDKFLVATFIPSHTNTDPIWGDMIHAIENKEEVAIAFKNNPANAGQDLSLVNVTADHATVDGAITGQTFTLTAGVDTMPSLVGSLGTTDTTGNDTINATNTTLSALDTIDGGKGNDTLNYVGAAAMITSPAGLSVSNVETANFRSAGNLTIDTSAWTGLTTDNVTQIVGNLDLTAAATTNVNVSGVTMVSTSVTGGNNVTVNQAASATPNDVTIDKSAGTVTVNQNTAGNVMIGTSGAVKGAVTVNDTNLDGTSGQIYIDGGTNITVNASGAENDASIQVGNASATMNPTGAVNITTTSAATTASNTTVNMGNIYVYGGTTVNIAQHAAASASVATDETAEAVHQGYVEVENDFGTITSVTSTQDAAVSGKAYTVATPAKAATTAAHTFDAIVGTGHVTYNGLTFTAYAGTTAAQTAAAFANLTHGAIQGASTLGTYSGSYAGIAMGAVTTAAGVSSVLETTKAATPAVAATAGVQTVTNEGIYIYDSSENHAKATDTIANVTLTNDDYAVIYGTALTTLSVTNSGDVDIYQDGNVATVTNTIATTLNATIDNLQGYLCDNNGQYTTMNITTAGADSAGDLWGDAMTALTVSGTNAWDITVAYTDHLQTVTVSGAAGVSVDVSGITTFTDFNAAATSGDNTVIIDATAATYEGGTGADDVTTTVAAPTKAISLGNGDDKLTLASGTTAVTGVITGGQGTDTLVMVAADAVTASGSTLFATKVSGFEVLGLTDGTGKQTVHADVLGGFNTVVTGGEADNGVLTVDGMASGGTLELNASAAGTGAYAVTNAAWATPTTDSFNIVLSSDATMTAGTVTANNIETLKITSTDTDTAFANANALTVVDNTATSITVTGNAALYLTSTAALVTSVNASSMTAGLTYIASGTAAQTVTGSATASNDLTANTGTTADHLIGGSAADTLTANAGMDTLTGGAGKDTFIITDPSANVNVYSTITDATVGDSIQFSNTAVSFTAAALTLGDTAVFQDYANLATASTTADGALSWFQFAGNTYVVENNSKSASFENGVDTVVKLTGHVDLSHTSLNIDSTNLLIG
jgi:S-layer protein